MKRKRKILINSVLFALLMGSFAWYKGFMFTPKQVLNSYCKNADIQRCTSVVEHVLEDGSLLVVIENGPEVHTLQIKKSGFLYTNGFTTQTSKIQVFDGPKSYREAIYTKENDGKLHTLLYFDLEDATYELFYSSAQSKFEIYSIKPDFKNNALPTYTIEYLKDAQDIGEGYGLVILPKDRDSLGNSLAYQDESTSYILRQFDSENKLMAEEFMYRGFSPAQGMLKSVNGIESKEKHDFVVLYDMYLSQNITETVNLQLPDPKLLTLEFEQQIYLVSDGKKGEKKIITTAFDFYEYNEDILLVQTQDNHFDSDELPERYLFVMDRTIYNNFLDELNINDILEHTANQ